MKKFFLVMLSVFLLAFAQAGIATEPFPQAPPVTAEELRAEIEAARAASKKETDWLSVREGKTREILGASINEVKGEISGLKDEVSGYNQVSRDLVEAYKGVSASLKGATDAVKDVDKKIDGAVKSVSDKIDEKTGGFMPLLIAILTISSLAAAKVWLFGRKDRSEEILSAIGNVGRTVNEIPEKAAALGATVMVEMEKFYLKELGCHKKTVLVRPLLKEGMRFTLRVPEAVKEEKFSSVEDIPRIHTTKMSVMRKDNAKLIADYLDGRLPKDSLQEKVIKEAFLSGELKEV